MLPAIRESKTERERTEIKQRVDKKRVNAISTVTAACVAHPLWLHLTWLGAFQFFDSLLELFGFNSHLVRMREPNTKCQQI